MRSTAHVTTRPRYGVLDVIGLLFRELLLMIVVFVVLVLISIAASSLATFLVGFSTDRLPIAIPQVGWLQIAIGWAISFASALLLFLAFYWVVPNAKLRLKDIWPGALLGAVLFLLIVQLFPLYLRFFGARREA